MRKALRGLVRRDRSSSREVPVEAESQASPASPSAANGAGLGTDGVLEATASLSPLVTDGIMAQDENPLLTDSVPSAAGEAALAGSGPLAVPDDIAAPAGTSVSEDLWSRAYIALAERDPELVKDYERHIGARRSDDEAAGQATLADPRSLKEVVETLQDERKSKQWKFSVRSRDKLFRDLLERLVKLLSFADAVIKQAVSAQPYAALAWSAVSIFLPVCKE